MIYANFHPPSWQTLPLRSLPVGTRFESEADVSKWWNGSVDNRPILNYKACPTSLSKPKAQSKTPTLSRNCGLGFEDFRYRFKFNLNLDLGSGSGLKGLGSMRKTLWWFGSTFLSDATSGPYMGTGGVQGGSWPPWAKNVCKKSIFWLTPLSK